MAAPGVTIVKSFNYRGNLNEEWTNQYHFVGSAPSDDAGWRSLVDDLVAIERGPLTTLVHLIRAYCYTDTDHDSVFTYDMVAESTDVYGSYPLASQWPAPGDAAAWVRWKTARLNSRGKPIYLRKYFHSVLLAGPSSDNYDRVDSGQYTAFGTYASSVNAASGDWPGLAGPDGVAPGASAVSTNITTRTLKRRGARP